MTDSTDPKGHWTDGGKTWIGEPVTSTIERIIAAACRVEGQTFSLLPPARHGNVQRLCFALYGEDYMKTEEQGFVTNFNRFVDRREAKRIAVAANQLTARAMDLPELYSEDVW